MIEKHCLKNVIYPNNFKFCAVKKNYKNSIYLFDSHSKHENDNV